MDNKVTINDIAMLTGLSKGTVDRVLHNRGEVSKKSYAKVMKVIEDAGMDDVVGKENICSHINIALKRAEEILAE